MTSHLPLALLLHAAPVVEGSTVCPSAEEVAHRLSALVPSTPTPTRLRLSLDEKGQHLRLALLDASGASTAEKALPRDADCARLAQAAAVVAASWLAAIPTVPVDIAPPVPTPEPPAASPKSERAHLQLGVALTSPVLEAPLALGLRLWSALSSPSTGHFGARLSASALGWHKRELTQLGPGAGVEWQRFALGLGATRPVELGGWVLEPSLECLLALVGSVPTEAGTGPPTGLSSAVQRDFGFRLGVGVKSREGLWLGLSTDSWPWAPSLAAPAGTTPKASIFEVLLGIGAALDARP